ncbi:hypothetical protein E4U16_001894 [Claviceps sp. LM84 group G4]|nr:hypothetical protein E4U33_002173 [Claviceps sp. LM78 group G4]KAG6078007.1 hypothetical protein E4U16_001894 [Claviceps sp. LM84 group G4]
MESSNLSYLLSRSPQSPGPILSPPKSSVLKASKLQNGLNSTDWNQNGDSKFEDPQAETSRVPLQYGSLL